MAQEPRRFRPKAFPPPQFPPRKLPLFARMPPAVFPAVLGLIGLALALKRASIVAQVPEGLADLALGLVAGLWLFCAVAYGIKLARRPAVVLEDLRILPGRAGLAAATMGALGVAAILVFFLPVAATAALVIGLALQAGLAVLTIRSLLAAPVEAREVTPVWHLSFVGFIVGALAAVPLGWTLLAQALLWGTLPVAVAICGISLWQLVRRIPPAPLRPLLAIHLAPASLFATVAALLGLTLLAQVMLAVGAMILIALVVSGRWITASGFSALWGAFSFPLAAYASALMANGLVMGGVLLTVLALGVIPAIAWQVITGWPKGTLAAKTNAATA